MLRVEERAWVQPAQATFEAGSQIRPAGPVLAGGRGTHRVEKRMRAREVAARFRGLRLGGLDRARRERLEHVFHDVLRGQPLDQLGLLQPHRGLMCHRPQKLRVLVVERPAARDAAQDPELLVPGRQRRDQQLVLDRAGAPTAHEVEQLRRAARP